MSIGKLLDSREVFEESINKYTNRDEIMEYLRYLKDSGVIEKLPKTKGKTTYEVVIAFLETVELLEEGTHIYQKVTVENQPLVIQYNKLAKRVEDYEYRTQAETFIENFSNVGNKISKEVSEVADYATGSFLEVENQPKKQRIKFKEFQETVKKKGKKTVDLFGFPIESTYHNIIQLLVRKKNRGTVKSALGIKNTDIKQCLLAVDKEQILIEPVGKGDEKIYKFYWI